MNTSVTTQYRKHWSLEAERFASAEVLLRYLDDGWEADPTVVVDWFAQKAGHYRKVYFFLLRRDGKVAQMPVLASPILPRLMADFHLTEIQPMGLPSALSDAEGESNAAARLM